MTTTLVGDDPPEWEPPAPTRDEIDAALAELLQREDWLARCPEPGCVVRWRTGGNRRCPDHPPMTPYYGGET